MTTKSYEYIGFGLSRLSPTVFGRARTTIILGPHNNDA